MIPARAYLAAGALALAFGAGWVSNGWRLGEQTAELQLAAADAQVDQEDVGERRVRGRRGRPRRFGFSLRPGRPGAGRRDQDRERERAAQ